MAESTVLQNFCKDITLQASKHELDYVVGRDEEMKRIFQILCRKKKRNPLLVGFPGVGKSCLVEKLAQLIDSGDVPKQLLNKKIMSFDITSIVAGTKYRGSIEDRMKAVIEEVLSSRNTILFIDEIQNIVGAGSSNGSNDISSMLKPYLSKGDIQLIGTTTNDDYRKYIEADKALVRRLQIVNINEPSVDETINILNNIKGVYEEYHNVIYTDQSIEACVKLSERYINDRFLPDKAIDLMDESGSNSKIDCKVLDNIKILKEKKKQVLIEKQKFVKKQDFVKSEQCKDEEIKTNSQIDILNKKNVATETKTITGEIVASIIARMTGIPVTKINSQENDKLINIEKELSKKVIGQDDAIAKVSKAIKKKRLGISSSDKPSSFFFAGHSGCGKCSVSDTYITIRNKKTGLIEDVKIGDFYNRETNSNRFFAQI